MKFDPGLSITNLLSNPEDDKTAVPCALNPPVNPTVGGVSYPEPLSVIETFITPPNNTEGVIDACDTSTSSTKRPPTEDIVCEIGAPSS